MKSTKVQPSLAYILHINYAYVYDVYIETTTPSIKYTENSKKYTGLATAGLEELVLSELLA